MLSWLNLGTLADLGSWLSSWLSSVPTKSSNTCLPSNSCGCVAKLAPRLTHTPSVAVERHRVGQEQLTGYCGYGTAQQMPYVLSTRRDVRRCCWVYETPALMD